MIESPIPKYANIRQQNLPVRKGFIFVVVVENDVSSVLLLVISHRTTQDLAHLLPFYFQTGIPSLFVLRKDSKNGMRIYAGSCIEIYSAIRRDIIYLSVTLLTFLISKN